MLWKGGGWFVWGFEALQTEAFDRLSCSASQRGVMRQHVPHIIRFCDREKKRMPELLLRGGEG